MTDLVGVWEHARYTTPRAEHGYCTDDNARALIVISRQPDPTSDLVDLARIYFAFVRDAALPGGGFHNRRAADESWADAIGSDDSQGRAIWGLGTAVRRGPEAWMRRAALTMLEGQMGFESASPRANAFAVLGASEALAVAPGHDSIRDAMTRWVGRLETGGDPVWPWPEARLAYDNARIPEALIAAGGLLDEGQMLEKGLRLLDWLVGVETNGGHFSYVPTGGWALGEPRPGFDQQPVETAAMADACARAWWGTGDDRWRDRMLSAARWLVGDNDTGIVLYDVDTGGCCDGLTPSGANLNQGAESTLAALTTLQQAALVVGAKPS
ncbi:MAG: glycosyltransferase [Acidimicrobiia bacterium]